MAKTPSSLRAEAERYENTSMAERRIALGLLVGGIAVSVVTQTWPVVLVSAVGAAYFSIEADLDRNAAQQAQIGADMAERQAVILAKLDAVAPLPNAEIS